MTVDPLTVVLQLSRSLGLTPDDLAQLAQMSRHGVPTLRAALDQLQERGFALSALTYPQGLPRILDGDPELGDGTALTAYGDLPYTELTLPRVRKDAATVHRLVGEREVARAAARGRPLAAADPKLYGHGAAEQYVLAARAIDRDLVEGTFRTGPQLSRLRVPSRPGPGRDKALEDGELRDYLRLVLWSSRDPELDALLWVIDRVAALRLDELVRLTVTGTTPTRPSVSVSGKGAKRREMPVHAPVLRQALALSAARPGRGGDRLFRTRTGAPVTARRFEDWSSLLHDRLDWAKGFEVRLHPLRHTTGLAVAARGGAHSDGEALYLGHSPDARLGTVAKYLGLSVPRLWDIRRSLAENTFGPLDGWPDLPENDVLADFLDLC